MIELIFVMLLLGLLLGTASPLLRGSWRGIALDVAADRLGGLLSFGRERAVRERARHRLEIEPGENRYWILVEDAGFPGKFRPLDDGLGRGRLFPDGVFLASSAPGIDFFPDGTTASARFAIKGAGDDARWVEIDGITGAVHIYDPPRN